MLLEFIGPRSMRYDRAIISPDWWRVLNIKQLAHIVVFSIKARDWGLRPVGLIKNSSGMATESIMKQKWAVSSG